MNYADDQFSRQFFELVDFIEENFGTLDVNEVLQHMQTELPNCHAETPLAFRRWAYAYVRSVSEERQYWQVTGLDKVIEIAKAQDTQEKPPFISEQHPENPDITFVQVMDGRRSYVWVVPTSQIGLAQALWPVEIRHERVHNRRVPHLIKKVRYQHHSGAWSPTPIERDLAAIWLSADYDVLIEPADGSFLNFLSGNLFIVLKTPEEMRADTNPNGHGRRHALIPTDTNFEDWKPAKATARLRNHDRKVLTPAEKKVQEWLHGDDLLDESNPVAVAANDRNIAVGDLQDKWLFGL